MLYLEPAAAGFLYLLSIGMGGVLYSMIRLPGSHPERGKWFLGIHAGGYMLAVGCDVLTRLGVPFAIARYLIGFVFWAGPALWWLGKWGMDRKEIRLRSLLLYSAAFLGFQILIGQSEILRYTLFLRFRLMDALILIWVLGHGTASLLLLRGETSLQARTAGNFITAFCLITPCWAILTCLNDDLALPLGLAMIPVIFLSTQAGIIQSRKGKESGPPAPDTASLVRQFGLSKREKEVLERVRSGAGNKEIAAALTISEHTVKRHMNSLFRKCGVSSRFELAALAMGWKGTDTKGS